MFEFSCRGVGVRRDRTWVLRAASMTIRTGHSVIVGPNGSGKSTLLDVLSGVLTPQEGSVDPLRCAYVPQHRDVDHRLPISVRDAVSMGRRPAGRRGRLSTSDRDIVEGAMARMEIADLSRRQLSALSGGQRQRVLVAVALAQRADVVFLDEATASVDVHARTLIRSAIADEVAAGRAVVEVTHDLAEASHADTCVVLSRGRVVANGPGPTILTSERIAAVWGGFG